MRLIDADALKTKAETIQTIDCWHMRTEEQAVLVEHIDNAPTIDAVPVVRCKDCRWRNTIGCDAYVAAQSVYACEDDGFCKWAERKSDD